MKNIITALILLLFLPGCNGDKKSAYRNDFTPEEQKILQVARQIIDSAYLGTLITLDVTGQPKARIMEPFRPDSHFVIYLATNPKSRKVKELQQNNKATLHYFDRKNIGYVSLYGKAIPVQDDSLKKQFWKEGWERFYHNRDKDYMLIRFIPSYLELISIPAGFTGDEKDWKPSRVELLTYH
jgi:general stress protein 26